VRSLGEATRPYIYLNTRQETLGSLLFVVRGPADDTRLLAAARRLALEEEPRLVLMEAKTMDEHLALLLFPPRMAAALLSIAGGLALGLAAIGLYGLVSYAVARRTREVGIRMALGAERRDIVRLIVRQGAALAVAGLVAGLLFALATARFLASFLFGISPFDPLTFAAVTAALAAAALVASWVPARRATRVDPVVALRDE
jgi:predicted lysophospholipase L1 biosynthesis ABC-type transport system permease subunit